MAERGATPQVPELQRKALRAARFLFTPLLPDDYLELINPLWSARELRGRIERIERETEDAVTVLIRPGYEWMGHKPGQYIRVGVVVDGVFHWRAYSLTSDPGRPDGFISITPKLVDTGKVSPYLVKHAKPGDVVRLGGVEGSFVLPDPLPERALFVSAGSGITPIMSMLRDLDRREADSDLVHVHSARRADDVIFGSQLERLEARNPRYRITLRLTAEERRIVPKDLEDLCADWREREAAPSASGRTRRVRSGRCEARSRDRGDTRGRRAAGSGRSPAGPDASARPRRVPGTGSGGRSSSSALRAGRGPPSRRP
jgi:ferredoxin-NADP reductase